MNLFGKKKKQAAANPNDVILRLRDTLNMLEKREQWLDKKAEDELRNAKQLANRNKRGTGPWIARDVPGGGGRSVRRLTLSLGP